jgi:hypothetical protein
LTRLTMEEMSSTGARGTIVRPSRCMSRPLRRDPQKVIGQPLRFCEEDSTFVSGPKTGLRRNNQWRLNPYPNGISQ